MIDSSNSFGLLSIAEANTAIVDMIDSNINSIALLVNSITLSPPYRNFVPKKRKKPPEQLIIAQAADLYRIHSPVVIPLSASCVSSLNSILKTYYPNNSITIQSLSIQNIEFHLIFYSISWSYGSFG